MTNDLGYGQKLSGEEYDKRVVELHSHASAMPSIEEEAKIRQAELNIAIDYRLGIDFPRHKREALWAIAQQIEKRRLWLGLRYSLRQLFHKNNAGEHLPKQANALSGLMIEAFSTVLNEKELHSFFELGPDLNTR